MKCEVTIDTEDVLKQISTDALFGVLMNRYKADRFEEGEDNIKARMLYAINQLRNRKLSDHSRSSYTLHQLSSEHLTLVERFIKSFETGA